MPSRNFGEGSVFFADGHDDNGPVGPFADKIPSEIVGAYDLVIQDISG